MFGVWHPSPFRLCLRKRYFDVKYPVVGVLKEYQGGLHLRYGFRVQVATVLLFKLKAEESEHDMGSCPILRTEHVVGYIQVRHVWVYQQKSAIP